MKVATRKPTGGLQLLDPHLVGALVKDTTALANYTDAATALMLTDGRSYKRVTSAATVDGVAVVSVSGASSDRWILQNTGAVPVSAWGAVGDGVTDDTVAISNALNSLVPVIAFTEPGAYYKMSGIIVVSNLSRKRIIAHNCKIYNTTATLGFLFGSSSNITIEGGEWGQLNMPSGNLTGSQHVMQFDQCQNLTISGSYIRRSYEMGLAFTSCNNLTIQGCRIENTYRDGIYMRYCANANILYNRINNCKDDCISFHGKDDQQNPYNPADKTVLNSYGYSQATNANITGNIIWNCYQGIVSIAGANVFIYDNTITNTVNAGIVLQNQKNTDPEALINSSIINNRLTNTCTSVIINGTNYDNNGQSGPGRAGIFVGSTGTNNQINQGETKRLTNVEVIGNTVFSSGANGIFCNLIDGLKFQNNKVLNTSGPAGAAAGVGLGKAIEMWNITGLNATTNEVTDNRATVKHTYGYQFDTVSGFSDNWIINGYTTAESQIITSTIATSFSRSADFAKAITGLTAKSKTTLSTTPAVDSPSGFYNYNVASLGGITDVSNNFLAFLVRSENGITENNFWAGRILKKLFGDGWYEESQYADAGVNGTAGWQGPKRIHSNRWFPVKETMTPANGDLLIYNSGTGQWENGPNLAVKYNTQTGTTYTLTEADNGKLLILTNAAAITLTLAPGLSTGWNCIVEQGGAGSVSWANGSGVTNNVYPASTTKTAGQRARVAIEHRGSNVFYLNGQLIA